MVSRERLLRLGATVAERATERRVRVLAQLLLVAAAVFVALRVRSIWHGGQSDGRRWAQRHNAAFERLLQAHGLDRARECGLETWKGLFERVPQGLRDQMHLSL